MEDQRAEDIGWQNEIRSGRDPSKSCGCAMNHDATSYSQQFCPSCFQPIPQKELSDTIVDMAAQHLEIESEAEKCNLKILFDAYAQIKMKELIAKAFTNMGGGEKRR